MPERAENKKDMDDLIEKLLQVYCREGNIQLGQIGEEEEVQEEEEDKEDEEMKENEQP